MSNSASLAAAKRRRGASQANSNPKVSSSNVGINKNNREPSIEQEDGGRMIHPIQLLGIHENRLEFLEKAHNNIALALNQYPNPNTEKIITIKDLQEFREAFNKISLKNSDLSEKLNNSKNSIEKEDVVNIVSKLKNEIKVEFLNKKENNDYSDLNLQLEDVKKSLSEQFISTNNFDKVKLELQRTINNLENKVSEEIKNLKTNNNNAITSNNLDELRKDLLDNFSMKIEKIEKLDLNNLVNGKQLDKVRTEILETMKEMKEMKQTADTNIKSEQSIVEEKTSETISKNDLDSLRKELQELVKESKIEDSSKTNSFDSLMNDFNSFKDEVNKSLESLKKTPGKSNKNNDDKVTLSFKLRLDELENKVSALEQIMVTK